MFRLMLNAHPHLVCPGEADFLTDHLRKDADGRWSYDLEALSRNRIFQTSRARLPDTTEALPAFRQMASDLLGDDDGTLIIVAHRGLDRLLELCGGLNILHVVRDPRDVARSAIGMGWAGHVYYGVDTWLRTEREWQACADRLSRSRVLEVRYETLVRDPEGMLTDICHFLGHDYDPAMLKYAEASNFDRPDPKLAEQWRSKQSPVEVGLVEQRLGDLLVDRGYSPSGHPKIVPGPLMRLALWAQNRRGTWAWRVRRHGWRDPILATLARRLRMPSLATAANARMQQTNRRLRK